MDNFEKLTKKAKKLLRDGAYFIDRHATDDYPERMITAADIKEVIKIGSVVGVGNPGEGKDRYLWVGEDAGDRILRLVVVIQDDLIVISAVEANQTQTKDYRKEDDPKGKG